MKYYKLLFVFCFIVVLSANVCSQDGDPPPVIEEISFRNFSSTKELTIRIFPVSMIFNNAGRYDLHSWTPDITQPITYRYMTSGHLQQGNPDYLVTEYTLPKNTGQSPRLDFQHEYDAQSNGSYGILGYGIYKIVFDWGTGGDTCLLEYDKAAVFYDITFYFYDNVNARVMYQWGGATCGERNITESGRYIKAWEYNW